MSPFTIFVLGIQVLLIQTVVSQAYGCGLSGYSAPLIGYSSGYSTGYSGSCGDYGGGPGEVSAAGDTNTCFTTCVDGKVPVLGSVCFGGCADACGKVSIRGQCGCGCQ